jgi:hypothetical protein
LTALNKTGVNVTFYGMTITPNRTLTAVDKNSRLVREQNFRPNLATPEYSTKPDEQDG